MSEFLASKGNQLSVYYAEKVNEYQVKLCYLLFMLVFFKNSSVNRPVKDETIEPDSSSNTTEGASTFDINILMKCESNSLLFAVIFLVIEELAKLRNEVSHIEKRKNWRNNHGETELHLEAKGDNTGRLKLLLQHVSILWAVM